ncbi:MAG: flagellar type III secretion system pore protein FliP [Spirochaetales bacterium]|nr:flagellar type III secretion system pore protein FliP [Spirochaetales bacterium]
MSGIYAQAAAGDGDPAGSVTDQPGFFDLEAGDENQLTDSIFGNGIPFVDLAIREPESNQEVALSIQLIIFLAILSLSPSIIILMTSFLRISVVFNFIRQSLSLQQVPPNSVLMGIALFLTLFIMWPTFTNIYDNGFKPFSDGEIGFEEMYQNSEKPIRAFMFRQMTGDHENIQLFMKLANLDKPATAADVPTYVLIPAFILNELTIAFKIGILLFVPFIIIDMVVASTLMSMGMIMLPPVMISLPFKMILFVLVDGWNLITEQMVRSFF